MVSGIQHCIELTFCGFELTITHEHERKKHVNKFGVWVITADIHTKLQQIESNTEGGGTLHLSNSIKQVEDVANRAFSPLLERQVFDFLIFFKIYFFSFFTCFLCILVTQLCVKYCTF